MKYVKKLLPGEAIFVKNGFVTNQWFWYKLPILSAPRKKISRIKAVDGVTKKLRHAVHSQMISDVPLGAFLSGGLDSSAIVAFAREMNPNIKCFSIETKGKQDKGHHDFNQGKPSCCGLIFFHQFMVHLPVTGSTEIVLVLSTIDPPDFGSPRGRNWSSEDPLKFTD